MEEVERGVISVERGLEGDHKGAKFPLRQVTIMSIEAWLAANAELTDLPGSMPLPWTARRANLLVENVELPRAKGGIIAIGGAEFEVTNQTVPCRRMDEAHQGLLKALYPDWRGGVTSKSHKIRMSRFIGARSCPKNGRFLAHCESVKTRHVLADHIALVTCVTSMDRYE